jgi:hypothetical protein
LTLKAELDKEENGEDALLYTFPGKLLDWSFPKE